MTAYILGDQVTKPGKSSVVFGYSWCASSVLASQVFSQALIESCDAMQYSLINYSTFKCNVVQYQECSIAGSTPQK